MVQEDFIVSKKIFWAVPGMRSKNISVKAGKQLSMSASKCLDFSLLSTFFTPCLHKWAPKVRKKKKKSDFYRKKCNRSAQSQRGIHSTKKERLFFWKKGMWCTVSLHNTVLSDHRQYSASLFLF